jgi:hypothetical protein
MDPFKLNGDAVQADRRAHGWTLGQALQRTLRPDSLGLWNVARHDFLDVRGYWRVFDAAGKPPHALPATEMQTAALIECPFWDLLEHERLGTFGRPCRDGRCGMENDLELIDGLRWRSLRGINFLDSEALDHKTGAIVFRDVRVYPVLESPDAARRIAGMPVADIVKSHIAGDPEVEAAVALISEQFQQFALSVLPLLEGGRRPTHDDIAAMLLHDAGACDGAAAASCYLARVLQSRLKYLFDLMPDLALRDAPTQPALPERKAADVTAMTVAKHENPKLPKSSKGRKSARNWGDYAPDVVERALRSDDPALCAQTVSEWLAEAEFEGRNEKLPGDVCDHADIRSARDYLKHNYPGPYSIWVSRER